MLRSDFDFLNCAKGAKFGEISLTHNQLNIHILGSQNIKLTIKNIASILIEPRTFDCPNGMSFHTQILWLVDEIFPFIGKEIIDFRVAEGEILAFQFAHGALGFKLSEIII